MMTEVTTLIGWRTGGFWLNAESTERCDRAAFQLCSMISKGVEVRTVGKIRDCYTAGYGLTWSVRLKHDRDSMKKTFDFSRSIDAFVYLRPAGSFGIAAALVS